MSLVSGFLKPLTGLLNKTYNSVTVRMSASIKHYRIIYEMRSLAIILHLQSTTNRLILGRGDFLNVKMPTADSLPWEQLVSAGSTTAGREAQGQRIRHSLLFIVKPKINGKPARRLTKKCRQLYIRCSCVQRQSGTWLYWLFVRRWQVCIYQPVHWISKHSVIKT